MPRNHCDPNEQDSELAGMWSWVPAVPDSLTGMTLRSHTIYSFNLDTHELLVDDTDLLYPRNPALAPPALTLKRINPKTLDFRLELCIVPGRFELCTSARRAAQEWPHWRERIKPDHEGTIRLTGIGPERLSPEVGALVRMRYRRELTPVQGESLFYCGSIQPSDYEDVRRNFAVTTVAKTIVLGVGSRTRPFVCSYFDGSEPVEFPKESESMRGTAWWPYHSHRQFVEQKDFEKLPAESLRARYFAVHARPLIRQR